MTSFHQTPIVLVHGILGFDRLGLLNSPISYFRGIRHALLQAGYTVPEPPTLTSAGSVKERAGELQNYLNNPAAFRNGEKVHLIAHSQGGLDSRYMISKLGMAGRVASLTTLGTPHHGTLIADLNIGVLGQALNLVDATPGFDLRGFFDLTRRRGREFAHEVVADPKTVHYFSIAGQYDPAFFSFDLLRVTHDFLLHFEGPNDGLVPVASASFGNFLGTWAGDHFRLVNWPTNLAEPASQLVDDTILRKYLGLMLFLAREMPVA